MWFRIVVWFRLWMVSSLFCIIWARSVRVRCCSNAGLVILTWGVLGFCGLFSVDGVAWFCGGGLMVMCWVRLGWFWWVHGWWLSCCFNFRVGLG